MKEKKAAKNPLIKHIIIVRIVIIIILVTITILSTTYAYLQIQISTNTNNSDAGCFQVSYEGTEINNTTLLTTTDYHEGATSNITLSKSSSCKIYTEANIYLNTNQTSTAPINTIEAMKYKIVTSDGYERNGFITTTGDTLLATVPLTDTSTTYTTYLWIDSNLSEGAYDNTNYSGHIYADARQTSTITPDTNPPSIFLKKESYIEGFNGWELAPNHTVDNDILTMSAAGTTYSNYYDVDGEYWYLTFDYYTETATTKYAPNGGIHFGSTYFDDNNNPAYSITNAQANDFSQQVALNTWKELTWSDSWNNRYGPNVKKVIININGSSNYTKPPTKIRNFKFHGQVKASTYDIKVQSSDNIGVTTTKYAKGIHDTNYFTNNGTTVLNNKVTVNENGTYTFYISDTSGNTNTTTIEITNII